MSVVGIQHGRVEPIIVAVIDLSGQPLGGKSDIKIRIRRQSDNNYFDWNDNTFKLGASVLQLLQALEEVDALLSPGEYKLNSISHVNGFSTSLITNPNNDDIYFVTAVQDGGGDAANMPQYGELRVGTFVIADHTPMVF